MKHIVLRLATGKPGQQIGLNVNTAITPAFDISKIRKAASGRMAKCTQAWFAVPNATRVTFIGRA